MVAASAARSWSQASLARSRVVCTTSSIARSHRSIWNEAATARSRAQWPASSTGESPAAHFARLSSNSGERAASTVADSPAMPCLVALSRLLDFPASEGPVLRAAFRRFASICRWVAMTCRSARWCSSSRSDDATSSLKIVSRRSANRVSGEFAIAGLIRRGLLPKLRESRPPAGAMSAGGAEIV